MKTPQELNELADRLLDCIRSDMPPALGDLTRAVAELRHMAQLQADLHEAAELPKDSIYIFPGSHAPWYDRRDSLLANLKGES